MRNMVRMDARALRDIMGEAFDWDEYEQGRKDARKIFKEKPECKDEKIDEVKRRIENTCFTRNFGPSYWIGCLCEADFTWPPAKYQPKPKEESK